MARQGVHSVSQTKTQIPFIFTPYLQRLSSLPSSVGLYLLFVSMSRTQGNILFTSCPITGLANALVVHA